MENWIQMIIELGVLLFVNGGIFFSINRRIKKATAEGAELDVQKKLDDEWKALYIEEKTKRQDLSDEAKKLAKALDDLRIRNGLLELEKQRLTWYRCTVNNCHKRLPPHMFDGDGNEIEPAL